MIPLLTIYADIIGILGGLTVGTLVMDFSNHYLNSLKWFAKQVGGIFGATLKVLYLG